jgi:hypothetical protein
VAGPKALGFFGQYLGLSTIEQVVTGPVAVETESIVGASPMSGVVQLFLPQLQVHLLVAAALLAISVAGLIVGILEILKSRKLNPVTAFALFAFVWLFSLMVEIVIFTGWVTGGGDDHTTRVLLRYYEFLFVIVPLAGLAVWSKDLGQKVNVFIRWTLFVLFSFLLTPAFTGFFASLTIQIADAPTLAGLVVNADVFNAAAVIGIIALLVFATFPKYTPWVYLALLPVTMVGTGWQIQDQYQGFRGTLSSADKAGQYLRDNYQDADIDATWILATSRFDATNIAIWADRPAMSYELFGPGTQVSSELVPPEKRFVIANGDLTLAPDTYGKVTGDGFTLYILDR